jgi:hypothetical protein
MSMAKSLRPAYFGTALTKIDAEAGEAQRTLKGQPIEAAVPRLRGERDDEP